MTAYFKLWPLGLLFILINELSRQYHGTMFYPGATFGPAEELRRVFYSVSCVFGGLLLLLFMCRESLIYSRFVLICSWPVCILSVILLRWSFRCLFKRYNFGNIQAIILGAGQTGIRIARLLNKNNYLGIRPVVFLDDNRSLHGKILEQIPVKGPLEHVEKESRELEADYIITCLPVADVMKNIEKHCRRFKHILIIPSDSMFSAVWVYAYDIGGRLGLEIRCNLMLKWLLCIKKLFDYLLAILISCFALPVMAVCALLIKITSKGPVLYKAKRLGVNGKTFYVYKFRSMRIEAEQDFESFLESTPRAKFEWEQNFKLKKDPRVTWFGSLLRRTSLDELPQLFNVLKGEMSLIGPRPIVESEVPRYSNKYELISSVKPGITGLWQVSGRSELDYAERVEFECYYIMNWNIWLDIFILLKTIKEVIFCRGAY